MVRLHCIALGLGVAFLVEEHSFSKLEDGLLITHGVVVVICLFVLGQGVLISFIENRLQFFLGWGFNGQIPYRLKRKKGLPCP